PQSCRSIRDQDAPALKINFKSVGYLASTADVTSRQAVRPPTKNLVFVVIRHQLPADNAGNACSFLDATSLGSVKPWLRAANFGNRNPRNGIVLVQRFPVTLHEKILDGLGCILKPLRWFFRFASYRSPGWNQFQLLPPTATHPAAANKEK